MEMRLETADDTTELKALARAVSLSQGFSLLFAHCRALGQVSEIEQRLQALLPDVPLTSLQLPRGVGHLLDELRNRFADASPRAVMVSGLERSVPRTPDAAASPLVGNLNAARNSFPAVLKCPLILWTTDYVLEAIAQGAPDFFSVRSGLYLFSDSGSRPTVGGSATEPIPISAALLAGAELIGTGTLGGIVRDAYESLKQRILGRAAAAPALTSAIALVEADPGDPGAGLLLDRQLQRAGVADDAKLIHSAQDFVILLEQEGLRRAPSYRATVIGHGAIAQGPGSIAVGKGVVIRGHHVGGIHTGDIHVGGRPGPDAESLRHDYLVHLFEDCGRVWLAGIDRHVPRDAENRLQLNAVYTALTTSTPLDEREARFDRAGRGARRLQPSDSPDNTRGASALAHLNRHPRLVLLGEPGSGKSTFLNFVALCMAGELLGDDRADLRLLTSGLPDDGDGGSGDREDGLSKQPWDHCGLVPVRVVLRDFSAAENRDGVRRGSASALWSFVVQGLKDATLEDYARHLQAALRRKNGAILLLDGMDEVPEASRQRQFIQECIRDFATSYPQCRILVTCRTYAYETPEWRLPDFSSAVLAPFDDAQIRAFVDRWYAHAGSLCGLQPADARGKAAHLQQALAANDRLRALAERPLLLALICSLHLWRGGSLPEGREELYADAVDLLLEWWESQRTRHDESGREVVSLESVAEWLKVDRAKVRALLERLAFEIHRDAPSLVGTADLAQERLISGLDAISNNPDVKPRRLIEYLSQRAGLLVPRGDGVYAFPHRTFQEYMAASHLTADDFPNLLAELVRRDPDRWREVALLAAAKAARGTPFALWSLVEELLRPDPGDPERDVLLADVPAWDCWAAMVAGEILVESLVAPLGQRATLPAEPAGVAERDRSKLQKARRWLLRVMRGAELPAAERARAGRALARLGDPRRGVLVPEEMELLPVTAGDFKMGDPPHTFRIGYDYEIGRYPVTQAQFQPFVAAGGYGDERFWPEAKAAGVWKDGFVKGRLESSPRRAPVAYGEPFWMPNHPVVGVTWYEALAFCRWLDERLREAGRFRNGREIRLPNEPEWERAARGTDGRVYPWGNDADPERANYGETGLGATSAVGCFSGGVTPLQAEEMSGNVWEWTRSIYGKMPYPSDATEQLSRENLSTGVDEGRVLRGGSFYLRLDRARCAFRYHSYPYVHPNFVGFRVVSSPSSTPD